MCECGRPKGECIKGDLHQCPVWWEGLDDGEEDHEEEYDASEDCGRWDNGRLMKQCRKAGSEECDWECPIGLPRS